MRLERCGDAAHLHLRLVAAAALVAMEEVLAAAYAADTALCAVELPLAHVVVKVVADEAGVRAEAVAAGVAVLRRRLLRAALEAPHALDAGAVQDVPPRPLQRRGAVDARRRTESGRF